MKLNVWTKPAADIFMSGLKYWPVATFKSVSKAIKSTGYKGKRKLAAAIKSNEFGWTGLHPFTISTHSGRKTPLIKLAQFTRYAARDDSMAVKIKFETSTKPGFANTGGAMSSFVRRAEEGQTVPYSNKVQRKLASMGFLIRKGTAIVVPQRKIFNPFFQNYKQVLEQHFSEKFLKWMAQLAK